MRGVWSEHWQADLPILQPLKQCWQHSCDYFLKPASASDAQHKDSTSLIDPCEACSEWNPSWETSVWPWPLYCNSVPGCYWTSYSLGHLCGEPKYGCAGSHITLQPKTGCPLKLSRVEPGQYLDGRPPGKTRLLLEEVLVRPAGDAHPVVCVGPNAPV